MNSEQPLTDIPTPLGFQTQDCDKRKTAGRKRRRLRLRRWPGVVLSFFVPGFGLFRAGAWRRGLLWMLTFYSVTIACTVVFALPCFPVAAGFVAIALYVILVVALLRDSFREGRMTKRLWVLFAIFMAVGAILPYPTEWGVRTFVIRDRSMEPTFRAADYLIIDCVSYRFSNPARGDLITFTGAGGEGLREDGHYVMRLAGLPGERVEFKNDAVYVNGRRLTADDGIPPIAYEPAYPPDFVRAKKIGDAYIVGTDEYFVLGDNTTNSFDSRFWGGVPVTNVIGRASKIYYPFSRVKVLSARGHGRQSN